MRLIDADALMNLPFEKIIHTDFGDTAIPIEEIEMAPTVEYPFYQEAYQTGYEEGKNERPQGEWKYICSYANTHLLRYECSKCGRTVDVYKRQELLVKYPFCHCGAEMKSGQEVSNDD